MLGPNDEAVGFAARRSRVTTRRRGIRTPSCSTVELSCGLRRFKSRCEHLQSNSKGPVMWKCVLAFVIAGMISTGGIAVAQTAGKAASKPRTAASIECSNQADQKALHGHARKNFR